MPSQCGRTLRKVLRNAFRRGILSDNSLLVVQGSGISVGLGLEQLMKAREHFLWHENPRNSWTFGEISTNQRGMKAKHSNYSKYYCSKILATCANTSHISLTHPFHSLPYLSGDLNSRTVLGPKGQVKDILQEVMSDPHIQAEKRGQPWFTYVYIYMFIYIYIFWLVIWDTLFVSPYIGNN